MYMQPNIPIIHALVPARGGSKSLPRKNIIPYNGKPLIVHSIEQSLNCPHISKTVVTTDDIEISEIAKSAGADVPFIRPKPISGDLSTDLEFMKHYINWLKEQNPPKQLPDIIVQLRPTYPNRTPELLNNTITTFLEHYETHSSLRTVIPIEKSAFKMYTVDQTSETLNPIVKNYPNLTEPYNRCRQELPQTYLHNGCIDIIKRTTITEKHSVTGDNIYPYIMLSTDNHDIDTKEDLERSEKSTI